MSSHGPLRWRPPRTLPEEPDRRGVIETDAYDWWHFRRLGAHEPSLFSRLANSRELIPIAFDLYAALYKPRWQVKKGATIRLSAAIGYLLERRGTLAALRQKTVLNEWATVVALPALLGPLIEALKKVRKGDGPPQAETGAGAGLAAQIAGNKAVGVQFAAYERACGALAAFDEQHGLDHLPAERDGRSQRSLSTRVGQPPLRRRNLTALLRQSGRTELLAERDRLVREVETSRSAIRAARDSREKNEESHAIAVAFGEDPSMNDAAAAASAAVEDAMALVQEVRHLFEENDRWGRERGSMYALPLEVVVELGHMLRQQPSIRRIVEIAGRWTTTLKRRFPRGQSTLGRREVVGVEVGGDIHRLLPSELGLLGRSHPILRRLALSRIAERRALLWQLRGPHLLGRGPVIIVVDTSGSMDGPRVLVAKALVLALTLRCWEKRRPVHVITFGAPGELAEISFRPGDDFGPRVRSCLRIAFGGGTDFDGPLRRVAELCNEKPWSQADAVFVTDGECVAADTTVELIKAVKKARGLEVIAVLLARGAGLEHIADHCFSSEPGRDDGVPTELFARLAHRL